jgi:hypothetical protein
MSRTGTIILERIEMMHYTLRGKITRAHTYQLDETLTVEGVGAEAKATGEAINSVKKIAEDHGKETSNPHKVTKEQVGLGNVNNTSDKNKPVSTAQAEAIEIAKNEAIAVGRKAESVANAAGATAYASQELARAAQSSANKAQSDANAAGATAYAAQQIANAAIPSSQKGVANGVATLNGIGRLDAEQARSTILIASTDLLIKPSHAGTMLRVYGAENDIVITLPGDGDDDCPVGTEIEILRNTIYAVKVQAPSDRYLLYPECATTSKGGSFNIAHTYGCVALKRVASQTWIASGDIK